MPNDEFKDFLKTTAGVAKQDLDKVLKEKKNSYNATYSSAWIEYAHECNSLPLFEALVRLFGTHSIDPNPRVHLIQKVIDLKWHSALQYLLARDPTLINVGCLWLGTVETILFYAIATKADSQVIKLLLEYKPDLSITNLNGENIFHRMATLSFDTTAAYLDTMIAMAPLEVVNARDNKRRTPYMKAYCNNFRAALAKKDISISEARKYPSVFSHSTKEDRLTELKRHFQGTLPLLRAEDVFLALIGKQLEKEESELPPKFFSNGTLLKEHLDSYLRNNVQDFTINGVVLTYVYPGGHFFNYVLSREEGGPVYALRLDSLGGRDENTSTADIEYDLKSLCKNYGIDFIEYGSGVLFQMSGTGCQQISTYIAGRIARFTNWEFLNETIAAYNAVVNQCQDLDLMRLSQLPVDLGVLNICQSISLIDEAVEELSSEQVPSSSVLVDKHLDEDGYTMRYHRELIDLEDNNRINSRLYRKNQNQLRHAMKALDLPDHELESRMADLLSLKDFEPGHWPEIIRNMMSDFPELDDLNEMESFEQYYNSNYYQAKFNEFASGNNVNACLHLLELAKNLEDVVFDDLMVLQWAVKNLVLDRIEILLDMKVSTNELDEDSNTALMSFVQAIGKETEFTDERRLKEKEIFLRLLALNTVHSRKSNIDNVDLIGFCYQVSDPFFRGKLYEYLREKEPETYATLPHVKSKSTPKNQHDSEKSIIWNKRPQPNLPLLLRLDEIHRKRSFSGRPPFKPEVQTVSDARLASFKKLKSSKPEDN